MGVDFARSQRKLPFISNQQRRSLSNVFGFFFVGLSLSQSRMGGGNEAPGKKENGVMPLFFWRGLEVERNRLARAKKQHETEPDGGRISGNFVFAWNDADCGLVLLFFRHC